MNKVIHVIPFDGIGGAESAARSMKGIKDEEIDFQLYYVYKNREDAKVFRLWRNFQAVFSAIKYLCITEPDILIVSLWRSAIVGIFVKLLRPRIKLITFLHSGCDVHAVDFLLTRLSLYLSSAVWADSSATVRERLRAAATQNRCEVISFVTHRLIAPPSRKAGPHFIYWGRINPQKRLIRAIRLFSAVTKRRSDARFVIVGPDDGGLDSIMRYCSELQLAGNVVRHEEASLEEIIEYASSASFYLQTSEYEGMAMSVVESMQLGLVPVVTPVGEVAKYCKNGFNSIFVANDDEDAVAAVMDLLASDMKYQQVRANAMATWEDRPLYRNSVIDACRKLLLLPTKLHD